MSPALSQHPLCSSSQDPNPSTVYHLLHLPLNPHPPSTPQQPPQQPSQLLTLLGVWGHLFHEGNKVFQELGVVIRQVEVFAILSGVWGQGLWFEGMEKARSVLPWGWQGRGWLCCQHPGLRGTQWWWLPPLLGVSPARGTGCGHLCRLPSTQPQLPAVPPGKCPTSHRVCHCHRH